ncbi:probable DIC1 - Mitochondrial dicarboxylate carrier protein [Melanopsichium pennsylvanicum]|uniref:Probable DIC1 - Mitochondrial dicarboxylate carrier protein n=2 Tax=Melanopsichium pennsylvanicum TaxID=63383 RepID=A0AAJ5C437_9BASI|nr:probable DIC1-Mitochondrial dicarboxylate carrier protein [Melanopsichium pennsylvanicum 4]SNX83222.1 probable DIC1 - Mitochondrial dicarboxylate carrier protein [Melanopsichium pennsylvanicum]
MSSPIAYTSPPPVPLKRKSSPPTKKYPFYLGGTAASIAALFTHPLDLTKTRMQTASARQNMFSLMVTTFRQQGPRGLYVGLSASLLRQMTYSVTRFGAYDKLKEISIKNNADGNQLGPLQMALCASAAGAAGGLAGNPADILLVRMTSDVNKAPKDRYNYANAISGLVRMTRDEGVASLFRGLGPNTVRAILMNASQLATYDVFKNLLLSSGYFSEGTGLHFSASFMAGTVATTVCSPADVIKSRVMNAAGSGDGIIKTLRKDLSKEGVGFLFRGWTPAWMRLSPNTIIVFVVLEKLRLLVDYTRERRAVIKDEAIQAYA